MNDCFKAVSFEGFSPIAKAIGEFPSNFCDFTPYVILTWQDFYKTEYAFIDSTLVLRHKVDGEYYYSPLTDEPVNVVNSLFKKLEAESITLSLLDKKKVEKLTASFDTTNVTANDDWSDYIYLRKDLAEFSGKRYAGQRNHINKFFSVYPDWSYEKITSNNLREVLEFYQALTIDTSGYDDTALYEKEKLVEYLSGGFYRLTLSGGLIRASGEIVAFAFGETIGDMLFVHVEKARRDIPGAYQMIVREFARDNTATYINREEDMGIEGLRISKKSYHPLSLEKKYKLTIKK